MDITSPLISAVIWHKFCYFLIIGGSTYFIIANYITLPIIFNFFVIPKIENRLRERLKYSGFIYWGKSIIWFNAHMEIGYSIIAKYLIWKLTGKVKIGNPKIIYILWQVNYDIRDASKFEIIMSLWTTLNGVLLIILAIVIWLVSN